MKGLENENWTLENCINNKTKQKEICKGHRRSNL